jgi:hypothetical protein
MFKAIALAAAALSFAGAVEAQTVTVNVAGSDSAAAHRQIVAAAHSVCEAQFWAAPLAYYAIPSCVRATVKDAEAQRRGPVVVASAADTGRDVAARLR